MDNVLTFLIVLYSNAHSLGLLLRLLKKSHLVDKRSDRLKIWVTSVIQIVEKNRENIFFR